MIIFAISFFLLVLAYFTIEYQLLKTRLKKIPIRIMVNGTRGKSTTVKIIYEILRLEKQKVFAKTTGEKPLQYLPNGINKTILRISPASILENIRILRKWAHESPDSVVMECMALQPETQFILSNRIFQPNYILITNILVDHAEVMGQNVGEITETILECLHPKAEIFMNENQLNGFFASEDLPNLHRIASTDTFPERMDHIPSDILDQNWTLIKNFTHHLKIDLQTTFQCFKKEWARISKDIYLRIPDLNISIWNLFSVNDTQSTNLFIQHSRDELPQNSQEIILLNTRKDRPLRTKLFAEFLNREFKSANIWITGTGRQLGRNQFKREGVEANLISLKSYGAILEELKAGYPVPTTIYCLANFNGMEHFIKSIQELKKFYQKN